MEVNFVDFEPASVEEEIVYNYLQENPDISALIPTDYEEYVGESELRVNYLEVADSHISLYAPDVTVGTQDSLSTTEIKDAQYSLSIHPA